MTAEKTQTEERTIDEVCRAHNAGVVVAEGYRRVRDRGGGVR